MEITLVTGNQTKLRNANIKLNKFGVKVLGEDIDTPEIQSTNPEEIAEYSAKYAYNILKRPVIKMDVSFEIDCLNGFPGPFVKFINKWLEPEKILKMIGNTTNRNARFVDIVCYVDGEEGKFFKMTREGKLSKKPCGENGWGVDKIFIPTGFDKTLAQMDEEERASVWGDEHWQKLSQYLNNKK